MALQQPVYFAESVQLFFWKEPFLGKDHVHGRAAMALAQDEAVPVGIARIFRIHLQLGSVQRKKKVNAGQRSAGMTGACFINRLDDFPAEGSCLFFQIRNTDFHAQVGNGPVFISFVAMQCWMQRKQLSKKNKKVKKKDYFGACGFMFFHVRSNMLSNADAKKGLL